MKLTKSIIATLLIVALSYLTINESHSFGMGQVACTHNNIEYGVQVFGNCPLFTEEELSLIHI